MQEVWHKIRVLIQIGRDPPIHIWKTENMQVVSVLKGQHQRGICALDFTGSQFSVHAGSY